MLAFKISNSREWCNDATAGNEDECAEKNDAFLNDDFHPPQFLPQLTTLGEIFERVIFICIGKTISIPFLFSLCSILIHSSGDFYFLPILLCILHISDEFSDLFINL